MQSCLGTELYQCRVVQGFELFRNQVISVLSCPNDRLFKAEMARADLFPCQVISVLNNPTVQLFQSKVIPVLN